MKIVKVFNNNVSLVLNDDHVEEIIMGKGVGFNKYEGDLIDQGLIEKRFILESDKSLTQLQSLLDRIEMDDIELASDIIQRAEQALGFQPNDSILLTLTDHISFMLQRTRRNETFRTPLEWDIKQLYTKEYSFALEAVQLIQERTGYEIPKQEAAFIALHFINTYTFNHDMEETMLYTKIIQNVVDITKYHYGREFDETSLDFNRFVTHIRYFIKRQLQQAQISSDSSIVKVVAAKYPQDYQCALKITNFLEQTYDWQIGKDELLYLSIHLNRLSTTK
ncbi:PRD domain-containing protein [Vagococcus sp. BWB3-3]|uniref:PRD domain-containing protein n=1 Tax=Vagococcus allomyrinae TaxID=2794353 RepID=A0A940P399_9ENTE|nr:PRD domain-containing protein [Vagococcus allomyrinae]MBP1040714.1 PRD domain-containing protein [Vagococcus allomyrinae]